MHFIININLSLIKISLKITLYFTFYTSNIRNIKIYVKNEEYGHNHPHNMGPNINRLIMDMKQGF